LYIHCRELTQLAAEGLDRSSQSIEACRRPLDSRRDPAFISRSESHPKRRPLVFELPVRMPRKHCNSGDNRLKSTGPSPRSAKRNSA
jgi:hypothetical protein